MSDAVPVCVSEAAAPSLLPKEPVQFAASCLSLQGLGAAVRQAGIQPGPFAGALSGRGSAVHGPTFDLGQPK